jgi:hypothetical protein
MKAEQIILIAARNLYAALFKVRDAEAERNAAEEIHCAKEHAVNDAYRLLDDAKIKLAWAASIKQEASVDDTDYPWPAILDAKPTVETR